MRYLKQLVLQGYKTFASRTEFAFDEGITAIVGPNGSGKSNISDALRWVLGEQSFGMLRARRTEDMIFSGSEQRARLGMAGATLTFDNASGWLPIDFSEVEISRRAYRSGENEYLINGSRVRLRDVVELLGSSGLSERTYTVIGQGLIDQALSLRPEERRRLFEEAAGITVHQAKREQAVRQLAEARANLTRARDITSELAPRMRYLKGQARRAQEYQQIKTDLEAQLKVWYGYRWQKALEAAAQGRERVEGQTAAADEQTALLNRLLASMAARRAERGELRESLGEWHRESSAFHRQAEAAQRELAVRSEQHRLLGEQAEDLRRDVLSLRAALEDGAQRLAVAQAELAEAAAAHQAQAAWVAGAERDLREREAARRDATRRAGRAEEALVALKTQLADRRARLGQLSERRAELAGQQDRGHKAAAAAAAQLVETEAQVRALEGQRSALAAQAAELEKQRTAAAAALAAGHEAERAAAERLSSAQRALARLQDRHDLLSRLRDEGAGLSGGARFVLAEAQRSGGVKEQGSAKLSLRGGVEEKTSSTPPPLHSSPPLLHGIVGALGELIRVPAELERAMEAALGGRMQDIVVRRWQDAEAAVSFLKQRQAGRATFLPLDSLHPGRPAQAPRMPGVLGVAVDLVGFDAEIRPAVELALNHVIVVQDLPTARRVLERERGATLVTLEGDIVRPGGSVTGGSQDTRRDSGLLARARELRELPPQIEAAQAQVRNAQGHVAAARESQAAAQAELNTCRSRQRDLAANQERQSAERGKLQVALERARQNAAWQSEQQQQAGRELAGLADRARELEEAITALETRIHEQEAAAEATRRGLSEFNTDGAVAALARLRAQAEVGARTRERYAARVEELAGLQRSRNAEIAAKEAKIAALGRQQDEAAEVIGRQGQAARGLAGQINALARQIEPAEGRLAQIESEQRADEARERAGREQMRQAQLQQSQAELALQRAEDELAHLKGEIEKELGLVDLAGQEAIASQPPLPLNGMITHLPTVTELPEGLDRDVRNLRAQISRLGPVNLDAPVEYAEVEARYNFLTGQAADLEGAVTSLEEIIAELDRVMEREFLSTFKAVAAEFREAFKNLFGGGAARLVLSDPDDPAGTGIEIIARPPGKREQGLALLSGGERALTAAALIFSILKVRPTPFCVLDEVDAALDEANAGRFRDALKSLSDRTQFILITHNRTTIEAADTIYGVSMGADNTSQVLSLKLEGQETAPGRVAEALAAEAAA